MQITFARRILLVPTACLGSLPAIAAQTPTTPPSQGNQVEAALPAEAWLYAHVGDLARVREIAQRNAWADLFQDEQVRPFFEGLTDEVLAEATAGLAPDAPERTLLDARAWWLGLESGAFWMSGQPPQESNLKGGALFQFNAAGQGIAEALAATMRAHLTPAADPISSGPTAEILSWHPQAGETGSTTTTFRAGNVVGIHFANSRPVALELARDAQSRLAAPALDPRANQWLSLARGSDWEGHGFEIGVDLATVLAGLPQEPELQRFLDVSGLGSSRYVWLGGSLCPGECLNGTFAIDLPERGVAADAAKLFGVAPRAWLDWMPADATGISLGSVDIAGAWDLFWRVFGEQDPAEHDEVRTRYDGFTGSLGFDFESDLVRQFDGRFASFTAAVPADELPTYLLEEFKSLLPSDNQQGVLWMVGLKDPTRVQELLERLLEQFGAGAEITNAKHAGAWIESVSFEGFEFHWSFTKEAWIASFSPSLIRGTLERMQDPALPDVRSQTRLMQGLDATPNAAYVSVADSAATLRAQFEALGSMGSLLGMFGSNADLEHMLSNAPAPKPEAAPRHLKGWTSATLEIEGRRLAIRTRSR
ncbi:MAG: hypothetical protein FJ299_06225 [Planctomycetes bacterium]|nr:hypothetical protein [Planctomycetota bacterium]